MDTETTIASSSATNQITQSYSYNSLKTYQKEFVRMVATWWINTARGASCPDSFSRDCLRTIAINNAFKWAPAWIVKDKARQTYRGTYMVPEVSDYISSVMPTETSETEDATADVVEVKPTAV